MDDCNLKSLKVKPGELSPVFRPDAVEYKAAVGSKVTSVTILCETNDRGASVSISVSITVTETANRCSYVTDCNFLIRMLFFRTVTDVVFLSIYVSIMFL